MAKKAIKKAPKKAAGPKARTKRKPAGEAQENQEARSPGPEAEGPSGAAPIQAGAKLPAKGKKPPKKRGKRKEKAQPAAPAPMPAATPAPSRTALLALGGPTGEVLDRLHAVVLSRRTADPAISHSARLLARGPAKVAQKFGEEAVECLIEAVQGNKDALVGESADVLYHLLVVWVSAGVAPQEVWAELQRREGVSGLAEKASRAKLLPRRLGLGTTKIP